jgi:D-alanyl-D-alanine carboxypeptidase/D-alanyl-D-alanine-endopeptidase (penicillin-binding protein 4)
VKLALLQRVTLLALVASVAGAGSAPAQQKAGASPTLQDQLNDWYRRAARAVPGQWGVAVADQSGRLLWGVNPTTPMLPASTAKVFTTGFARTVLGGSARQSTRVLGTGYVDESGEWRGSWVLEVNGDPTLERPFRSGPMLRDLAAQLADRGIRRLTGPLAVRSAAGTAEARYPDAWSPRHRGRRFAPLIGALTLNENLVSFTIAPASRAGLPPRLVASTPDGMAGLVDISARTVSGRRDRLRVLVTAEGRYQVTGTIGVGRRGHTYSGTAANPRLVLGAAWQAALDRAGIAWTPANSLSQPGSIPAVLTLAEVVSAPLDSMAREINTRSLNIGAEALLGWAGGWSADAARKLTEHVREVIGDDHAVTLVDGSGLSSEDRATPMSFITYLARFPTTPAGRNFSQLLPANGSGTLRKLVNGLPAPGVVRAKTGTLGNAATLVGYLGQKDGVLLVSVMYNGPRVAAAKQQQWRLFRALGADGSVIPDDSTAVDVLGGEDVPPR